jgi:predicted lipid-binding transport protein (Tim44 family)
VTDPSQRCEAQTVCPDVTSNTAAAAAPRNAAGSPAAFAVSQVLGTLLGVAMLALML